MTPPPSTPISTPPSSSLPTVDEVLSSPYRPYDLFSQIPRICLHSAVLLFIRTFRAAASARSPQAIHDAFICFHILPTAVFRRALRGELGWRSSQGQDFALRAPIRRATSGGQWGLLWTEAMAAHKRRSDWNAQHVRRRHHTPIQCARVRRALRLAGDAQYSRAMRALASALSRICALLLPCLHYLPSTPRSLLPLRRCLLHHVLPHPSLLYLTCKRQPAP